MVDAGRGIIQEERRRQNRNGVNHMKNVARGSNMQVVSHQNSYFSFNIREFPEGLVRLLQEDVLVGVSVSSRIPHPDIVPPVGQHVSKSPVRRVQYPVGRRAK